MLAAVSEEQLARPRGVSTLRLISHGGSPVATATLRRARSAFPEVELMQSCGQPAIGVEVAVLDPSSAERAAAGTVGEVAIRGDNVMAGYWNKPDATAAALAGGWYHSGDLGYLDDRGFLYLVDRAKDMIVTGAENVYSVEVEEALYRHASVLEAAVFGIPDERWGEAVHAVVVPRAGVGEAELLAHCRALIASYKVPKRIELRQGAQT